MNGVHSYDWSRALERNARTGRNPRRIVFTRREMSRESGFLPFPALKYLGSTLASLISCSKWDHQKIYNHTWGFFGLIIMGTIRVITGVITFVQDGKKLLKFTECFFGHTSKPSESGRHPNEDNHVIISESKKSKKWFADWVDKVVICSQRNHRKVDTLNPNASRSIIIIITAPPWMRKNENFACWVYNVFFADNETIEK